MEKIVSGPRSISAEAKERHQTPSSSSSSSSLSFAASPHSFEGNATSSIDNNNGSEKTKMIKQENITTRHLPLRQSIRSNRGVPSARMLDQDELFQQLIIDAASSDSSSSSSPSSSTTTPAPNKKRLRDRRGEQENANEEDEEEEAPAKEEEEDDEGERNERKKATKHTSSSMISKTGGLLGKRSRTSNTSTAPPSQPNDHGRISIIRNRLTNGLLKVIRQQLHGPPPSGKKPYSKYEEGMNEKTALQLMNGYDDYQTSDTKKSIRWLFYDSDKITEFLALPNNNNIISNVPYGGWVRVRIGQPTPSILKDAEFEALEVRYDRERNLFVLTSRTRLYYNENDAYYKWPVPGKLHFNPPH